METKVRGIASSYKIVSITFVMAVTLLYAIYSKRQITNITEESKSFIIKTIPNLSGKFIEDNTTLTSQKLIEQKKDVYIVHFWGTWCGPCELEFPELLKLAELFKNSNVNFLLIAVNDELKAINKFLKRFKNIPENVAIAIDNSGESMKNFGTIKVPETYLFDKRGNSISKFVGPQDWLNPYFSEQIKKFASNQLKSSANKIE